VYSDYEPCQVCGSEVELREPRSLGVADPDGPTDERVCLNPDCETNAAEPVRRP
jgi:hypothetical protein